MSEKAFRIVGKGMSLSEQHLGVLVQVCGFFFCYDSHVHHCHSGDLLQVYQTHAKDIRDSVSRETGTSISQYRNLEWRIDLEVGIVYGVEHLVDL